MKFGTVINCMDGRTQLPAIDYLRREYKIEYVDSITEPGPNGILAGQENQSLVDSILQRIDISVNKHDSRLLAVVGHYDCAGNPGPKEQQITQVKASLEFLEKHYPHIEKIGLWIDRDWVVHQL